jgi:hypothetical protein
MIRIRRSRRRSRCRGENAGGWRSVHGWYARFPASFPASGGFSAVSLRRKAGRAVRFPFPHLEALVPLQRSVVRTLLVRFPNAQTQTAHGMCGPRHDRQARCATAYCYLTRQSQYQSAMLEPSLTFDGPAPTFPSRSSGRTRRRSTSRHAGRGRLRGGIGH